MKEIPSLTLHRTTAIKTVVIKQYNGFMDRSKESEFSARGFTFSAAMAYNSCVTGKIRKNGD
jgi:hypothetical protein